MYWEIGIHRCRKCNGMILVLKIGTPMFTGGPRYGNLFCSSSHPHCTPKLAETERAFCDLVSMSEELPNDTNIVEYVISDKQVKVVTKEMFEEKLKELKNNSEEI